MNPNGGHCNGLMMTGTERSSNPPKHQSQTIPAALKAKAASAQSCVEPNASVVVTTATQIVKKTRRPATVGRRFVCSGVDKIPLLIRVLNASCILLQDRLEVSRNALAAS